MKCMNKFCTFGKDADIREDCPAAGGCSEYIKPQTRFDRFIASPEALARFLIFGRDDAAYCRSLPECDALVSFGHEVPDERETKQLSPHTHVETINPRITSIDAILCRAGKVELDLIYHFVNNLVSNLPKEGDGYAE